MPAHSECYDYQKNCISRGRIQIPVVFIKSPMIEIIIKDTLNPFTPKI